MVRVWTVRELSRINPNLSLTKIVTSETITGEVFKQE
jgi:hypothetical protein